MGVQQKCCTSELGHFWLVNGLPLVWHFCSTRTCIIIIINQTRRKRLKWILNHEIKILDNIENEFGNVFCDLGVFFLSKMLDIATYNTETTYNKMNMGRNYLIEIHSNAIQQISVVLTHFLPQQDYLVWAQVTCLHSQSGYGTNIKLSTNISVPFHIRTLFGEFLYAKWQIYWESPVWQTSPFARVWHV